MTKLVSDFFLLLFIAQMFVTPTLCYGRYGRRMSSFYSRMLFTYNARALYVLVALFSLLVFHFLYLNTVQGTTNVYDVLPSSALCVCLFRQYFAERIFHFLQSQRTFFLTALLVMTCAFTPHFHATAICLAFLMECALFYPSANAMDRTLTTDFIRQCHEHPKYQMGIYNKWN